MRLQVGWEEQEAPGHPHLPPPPPHQSPTLQGELRTRGKLGGANQDG